MSEKILFGFLVISDLHSDRLPDMFFFQHLQTCNFQAYSSAQISLPLSDFHMGLIGILPDDEELWSTFRYVYSSAPSYVLLLMRCFHAGSDLIGIIREEEEKWYYCQFVCRIDVSRSCISQLDNSCSWTVTRTVLFSFFFTMLLYPLLLLHKWIAAPFASHRRFLRTVESMNNFYCNNNAGVITHN